MSKRILVVDDHEDTRRILNDFLTTAGYEIIEAASGEEGIAAAQAHRPDLILMDIRLPGVDGYEATRRIKADPALSEIPIIAMTSYAEARDEANAFAAGCDAYIPKPLGLKALLARIVAFLP